MFELFCLSVSVALVFILVIGLTMVKPYKDESSSSEQGCDFCHSNCGQCGSSHPKTGNGSEVFDAAVKSIS